MGNHEAQNNIPILLLQTDVAVGILLQEQNSVQAFICLTRPLSPRTGFEANYFRVAQAGKSGIGSYRPWRPQGSELIAVRRERGLS